MAFFQYIMFYAKRIFLTLSKILSVKIISVYNETKKRRAYFLLFKLHFERKKLH